MLLSDHAAVHAHPAPSKLFWVCWQTIVDDALELTEKEGHAVEHVVVLDHKLAAKRSEVPWKEGRDKWWQDVMDSLPSECPVEWVDAEAPLFKVCSPLLCAGVCSS